MATLICRYLMDEGSGTTFADSSGNGYDLTITAGGGSGWTTLDGGNGWEQGSRTEGSKAQSETAHLAFDGLSQVTAVMVLQNVVGNSQMPRAWFIGSDGGNGIISTNVDQTDATTGRYEGRWMREPTDANHVRNQFETVSYENYHVLIMEYDPVLFVSGSHIKAWFNGTQLEFYTGESSPPMVALDVRSTDRFCLFNRPAQNNGAIGKYGYFEAWDGLLTAQEKTDATNNLLADCDTAWDGGGPAPGAPSFCWSPDNGTTTPWQTLAGTGYQQLLQTHSAVASMDAAFVAENTNQSFCFDWAQLETGRIATSCIETTGATGTRVRSRVVGDPMSKYTQQEMRQDWAMQIKFSLEMDLADTDPTGSGIWLLTDGTVGDLAYGVMTSAGLAFRVMVGGVYHDVQFLQASVQAIKRHEEIDLRCKWTSTEVVAWLSFPGQAQLKATNVVSLAQWPLRDLEIWLLQLEAAGPSASDTPGVVKSFRWECPAPIDTEIEAWT